MSLKPSSAQGILHWVQKRCFGSSNSFPEITPDSYVE